MVLTEVDDALDAALYDEILLSEQFSAYRY
jgi:hypothetical protein